MNTDIKHKHAGHLIEIGGQPFKANESGMWNLTEIWQTLKLPKGKAPGRWRGKERDRLSQSQNLDVRNLGDAGHRALATKRAAIEYAAWVSPEFKEMVFDAFEAILERPEVAQAVAEEMHRLGHKHSAAIIQRMTENQERNQILRGFNRGRTLSPAQRERKRLDRRVNAEANRQRKAGRDWH